MIIVIIYGIVTNFINFLVLMILILLCPPHFNIWCWTSDKIIWHFSKSDKYEVRYDYHLAKDLTRCSNANNRLQANFHSFPKNFWSFLCSLKVRNKYKHFLRKCILNVLQVNTILSKILTYICDTYKVYSLETESIDHMFFKYLEAQIVRKLCPINRPDLENILNFSI